MQAFNKIDLATLNKAREGKLPEGRLPDGGGLFLKVFESGVASWLFRYGVPAGDARKLQKYVGLGRLVDVPEKKAREEAARLRREVAQGRYPHEAKGKQRPEAKAKAGGPRLLKTAVEEYLREVKAPSKHKAHEQQWKQTLQDYVIEPMGHLDVRELTRGHVIEAFRDIWKTLGTTTVHKTLGRLRKVLAREIAFGRIEVNVAELEPIQAALGNGTKRKTKSHNTMDYKAVPGFMAKIAQEKTVAAEALRFLTLTAARTIEVRKLRRKQLDLRKRLWEVPDIDMKMDRPHRVPLSKPAVAILQDIMDAMGDDDPEAYVFPGSAEDGQLSENTLLAVMRRYESEATPHGQRSAFRNWCSKTKVQFEVAEWCLSHLLGTDTTRAYERYDYLAERRVVMEAWGRFCTSKQK